nr:hypothetical protein [candidate division Zixibacteria bacterium]
MNFIAKLNRLIGLYLISIRWFFRGRLWLPFILYAILQFIILIMLCNYVNPFIYTILSPLVGLLGDRNAEYFGHYPSLYLMLPFVFQWLKLAASIIFEGLAIGLTAALFIRALEPRRANNAEFPAIFRKWPALLVIWVIISGIIFAVNWYAPAIFHDYLSGSPRRMAVFDIALKLVGVVIYSVFIYAVPAVIAYGENILGAFKTSFRLFAENPVFTFFLTLFPFLLTLPITYLSEKVEIIVDKFSPELVFYILLIGIIVDAIVNYILTGAVVKFLLEEE